MPDHGTRNTGGSPGWVPRGRGFRSRLVRFWTVDRVDLYRGAHPARAVRTHRWMPSPHGHITLTGSIDVSLAADLAAMIRALTAAVALTAWIAIRLAAPAWRLHLPRPLDLAWRFLVPPAALLLAASDMPTLSVVLAVAFASAHRFGTRTVGTLRREVHAEARAFETALHHAGRPATFDEVALCVLLGRFAGHSMARAEAAVLAGRCADLDELGAQVALRQGGMSTYAAYVRRYGRILDVADADTAARRDRFPDGTPG